MADQVYRAKVRSDKGLSPELRGPFPLSRALQRRLPAQTEQERRREWGNTWGPLVRDAVKQAMEGR